MKYIENIMKHHHKQHKSRLAKASFCIIATGEFPSDPEKRFNEIINEWYGTDHNTRKKR